MKQYPSISKEIQKGLSIYAFEKIDGSSIRSEWSPKQKFYKFGSRTRLLGEDQPFINEAKELFINKYENYLDEVLSKNRWERVVIFSEFFGPNSFAGTHQEEKHDIVIFDVNIYKKGFLPPKDFINYFGHLDVAKLLYHGPCDHEFVESVKGSTLDGMGFEGVVAKAKNPNNKIGLPIMFKIKSNAWLEKLK